MSRREIFSRLAAIFLPLLLIGHLVTTRLAATLYHAEPNYRLVVSTLVRSGAQGWQLALLAPGWLHGCLGLWLSLRRFAPMRRARPVLIGIVVLIPLLSAFGFLRMEHAVSISDVAAPSRPALGPWREAILTSYITLVAGAFVAGRVRSR